MITVSLVLKIGRLKHGVFESYDEYDLEEDEDVSSILYNAADAAHDRAVLIVHVTGWPDDGRALCTYKRIKLKTKDNSTRFKWIVAE